MCVIGLGSEEVTMMKSRGDNWTQEQIPLSKRGAQVYQWMSPQVPGIVWYTEPLQPHISL